jgi:hypothetical protein
MPTNRPSRLGAILAVVAAAFFGSLGVASRPAHDEGLTPFAFVALHATVGAIGLWLFVVGGP